MSELFPLLFQSSTPFIFEQEEDAVNDSDSHVMSTGDEAEGKTQSEKPGIS